MGLELIAAFATITSVIVSNVAQNQIWFFPQPRRSNITGLRFKDVSKDNGSEGTEFYGLLEFNVDGRTWLSASWSDSYRVVSESTGNVICRSLGYGPFRSGWRRDNAVNVQRVNLAAFLCYGNESTVNECALSPNQQFHVQGSYAVFIRCAESRCASANGNCSQICLNNPHSPSQICECQQGFLPSPISLTDCIDVDECLVNNGGCTFNCINTPGSYTCTCPIFGLPDNITGGCTTTGFKLSCGSNSMTIAFLKNIYPMLLRDEVTLLGSECAPAVNQTHIFLTTLYDSCMTVQSEDERGIIYSNAVVSKGNEQKPPNAVFAATVNIPFHCVIQRQSESSISVKSIPSTLSTSPFSSGKANIRLRMCFDTSCNWTMEGRKVNQGVLIYVALNLISNDNDLKFFVKRCSVRSNDDTDGKKMDLILKGMPAVQWVRVANATGKSFRFSYPAFTLSGGQEALALECQAELRASAALTSETVLTTGAGRNSSTASPEVSVIFNVSTSSTLSPKTLTRFSTPSHLNSQLENRTKQLIISSCEEATADGIHQLMMGRRLVPVWCDRTSHGGPWLTVMRRSNSGLNFNRSFAEYGAGFGSVDKEFWLGNAYLHEITRYHGATLRIELTNFSNVTKFAEYSMAVVGDASGGYNLTLGAYRGSAGDMRNSSGCLDNAFVERPVKFSTYDADNDEIADYRCAGRGGGWWYHDCACTCLTCGPSTSRKILTRNGMTYHRFSGLSVLKKAEIKLKFGTLKSVQPESISIKSSIVECDTQQLTVFLDKGAFGGPYEESLAIHSVSLLHQSQNTTHVILTFSLWSMDTLRQENITHIIYSKMAFAETTSGTTYYKRLVINPKCIFDKSISLEMDFDVAAYDVNFEITGGGNYETKIIMARDEGFSTPLSNISRTLQGSTIYVKVVPVVEQEDLRLALLSCNLSTEIRSSYGYKIIHERCSIHKDVEIIARDAFFMKLPSFAVDEQTTRLSCDVQVCSANDVTCDSGCDNSNFLKNSITELPTSRTLVLALLRR